MSDIEVLNVEMPVSTIILDKAEITSLFNAGFLDESAFEKLIASLHEKGASNE